MIYSKGSAKKQRGSALAISLILAAAIAIMAGSYLKLTMMELNQSNRAFFYNSMLNLAEMGAEEALWALNNEDFGEWISLGGEDYIMRMSGIDLGNNAVGDVIVMVEDIDDEPAIFINSNVTPGGSAKRVVKQFVVKLANRSYFANGLTSKNSVTFSGNNAEVDSYNSDDGPYNYYIHRNDKGTVATASVVATVDVNNADIFGYVATGGTNPDVGPNGKVYGKDTPTGVSIDTDRISKDFYFSFPKVEVPTLTNPKPSLSAVFDLSDEFFFAGTPTSANSGVPTAPGGTTYVIGQTGAWPLVEYYKLSDINLGNDDTLVIQGPVVIVVENDIAVKGEIRVELTGSAEVYVDGDVDIGGNGIVNLTNKPANMMIFNTDSTEGNTSVKLHGNGALSAAVYAPNSNLELKGGGNSGVMFGAVVANDIQITGNYEFHYDEALGEMGGLGWKLANWKEIYRTTEMYDMEAWWENASAK